MDPDKVRASLRQIGKIYSRVLDEESKSIVIPTADQSVLVSRKKYDYEKQNAPRGITPTSWGYSIDHNKPLRFIPSDARDLQFVVDIYCDIQWKDDDIPVKQDIKVRIWSEHGDTIFRPAMDSQQIEEQLTDATRRYPGRVVSRFHFDRVNRAGAIGSAFEASPEYHLQLGGISHDYELCWHPDKVNIPRLMFQPMELFLTCQLVTANFFWKDYEEIKKKSEWKQELVQYQKLLLMPHYRRYVECLVRISHQVEHPFHGKLNTCFTR
ncbi:MAG: hypothetical protein JWM21_828 [Acidobacteria bacterium]|nr:hypothetical protein [Acidobacteriota bacterium]